MDVSQLSNTDLDNLAAAVHTELSKRRNVECASFVSYVRRKAEQIDPTCLGNILMALTSGPKRRKYSKRKAPSLLFTDPASGKTFNGLGRPPLWFLAYRDAGGNVDDICVKM